MDKANFRELFSESEVKAKDTESGIDILVYRLTGLTPQEIMELKERDTARAPIKDTDSGVRYTDDYICPNCGRHFTGTGIAAFCYRCGQRLKWEE